MLLFNDMLYMLVRCESKQYYVLEVLVDFISHMQLLVLLRFIATWTCVVVSVILVVCSLCVPIYVSVCVVGFVIDCVGIVC